MKQPLNTQHVPLLAAAAILLVLLSFGAIRYDHFADAGNLSNLVADYSFVLIAAAGATLVILSGGIDLSVGSMVAFSGVVTVALIGQGWHPLAAGGVAVCIGAGFGALMGWIIQFFELPAFMVTLAGMFALRAAGFLILDESTGTSHPFFTWVSREAELDAWGVTLPLRTGIMFAAVVAVLLVSRRTRFGMNIYAIGGSEGSARMLGVPIARTRVGVFAIAGVCSALAGFVLTLDKRAADPTAAMGLELPVIASVVIGGTLLRGGVGSVLGTVIGVLILGVIRMLIDFQGNLNSAWTSIATGGLLLVFVGLQHLTARLSLMAAARYRGQS
jgi:ribose/xylose/arabinose/galactoside ABC-type transport system permease subunit